MHGPKINFTDFLDNAAVPVAEKRPNGTIRIAIETEIETESEVYLTPAEAAEFADKIKSLVYCN